MNEGLLDTTLAILLVIIAALVGLGETLIIHHQISSEDWPTTSGTVSYSGRDFGMGLYRSISVSYRYTVSDQMYLGEKYQFFLPTRPSFWFELGIDEYLHTHFPAGKSVSVHYNPEQPAEAVLDTRFTIGSLVGIPIILFLLYFAWWLVARRQSW